MEYSIGLMIKWRRVMFLKQIHVENFRLLMNYDVTLDEELTLFVGKNNAGKTSLMNLMSMVVNGNELKYDDYPIQCRHELYAAFFDLWNETITFDDCVKKIPVSMIRLCIDYSKESDNTFLGGLSPFIIDLDENISEAIIVAKYSFIATNDTLNELKKDYYKTIEVVESNNKSTDEISSDDSKIPIDLEQVQDTKNVLNIEIISSIVEKYFFRLFTLQIFAINPNDEKNVQIKSKTELKSLFVLGTVGAERSLDEADDASDRPLGIVMSRLFKSDMLGVEEEIAEQTASLSDFVDEQSLKAENIVNNILSDIVDNMISFGYPTAEDMQLYAKTRFSMKNDIINNTDLQYVTSGNEEALPSSHNGLGYKNLIKITLPLKEFSINVKQNAKSAIPILFLEEPEAHMHPQLQEVFVGHLQEVLSKFAGNKIQIIMSTHSPHIANTVPFRNIRYLRRESDCVICKNLNEFGAKGSASEGEYRQNIEFLRKYLTLSRCDLYFCDKAILVEGAAERLLIPDMIRKCDERGKFGETRPNLFSQYCSIIEVGGAYAHRFLDFVNFLEIPTLILTDIDFVDAKNNRTLRKNAENTSNATIKRWGHDVLNVALSNKIDLKDILGLTDEQKTNGLVHIEFQREENCTYPRSLEEAIMNVNREHYGIVEDETEIDFDEKEEKKTDFALDLIFGEISDSYQIPSYIEKGLVWLNEQSKMPTYVKPKRKYKRSYKKI